MTNLLSLTEITNPKYTTTTTTTETTLARPRLDHDSTAQKLYSPFLQHCGTRYIHISYNISNTFVFCPSSFDRSPMHQTRLDFHWQIEQEGTVPTVLMVFFFIFQR